MGNYEEVWEKFRSERRLECGGHTDPSWKRGHALSASFITPVEVSRLHDRISPLREALRPFPFVSLHPDHFMHITLCLLGFLVPEPENEKELSREQLSRVKARAGQVLTDFPAFTARLANLNAFPGAAFVEVHDGGMLERLRETLCQGCGFHIPAGPPHLTLAYLQAEDGSPAPDELVSAIESYRDWPVGETRIDLVEMTLLDLSGEYPKPEPVAQIPLKRSGRQVSQPA